MTQSSPPVNKLSNYGSLAGMMRSVLNNFLQGVDDMLPASVISFDRSTNRVRVQPLIMLALVGGKVQARAQIASIPVLQLGGGNVMLNFNINPGDIGFIKASDRDMTLFLQSFTQSGPNTYRKHSFEDAIFIPAPMHGMHINSEDASHGVLSTTDGKQCISLWPDRIKMTSTDGTHTSAITIFPDHIVIDTPLTTFTGDIASDGTSATGDAAFNGTLRAKIDVIAVDDNISLVHHKHSGVTTGGSNTGPSVP